MARPISGDKPKDIQMATIEEAAAIGSTAVSVNKIAARAGVSVGTLYRYHSTKDDLLVAVFLQIKRDIHDAMMAAAQPHHGPEERISALWFAMVTYGFQNPKAFQFAEMMNAEDRPFLHGNATLEQFQADILTELQAGMDQDILIRAPLRAIEMVLAAPAVTMIRRAALGRQAPLDTDIQQVFRLIWRGIAR